MSLILRIILIFSSVFTCVYIQRKIRKSKFKIEDSIFWICLSLVLVLVSVVPQIPSFFADLLGFESTVNFVFLLMIFLLLVKVFLLSRKVSETEDKLKQLVQEVAIGRKEKEE
ncbi:MAG: DUF2304 domain-containing protein [Lachnospiraceae bacterium]|nr:DUF2304 domain-containing protein [Lachnospiraceae bacterium]